MLNYLLNSGYYNNHPMNVIETENGMEIELRATGLKKEDVSVKYENGILEINGETKDDDKLYSRQEFRGDRYLGTKIELPYEIDPEKIEASLDLGILKIKLIKDQSSSKLIEIK